MSNKETAAKGTSKNSGGFSALMATIAIAVALVLGIIIYKWILGNPSNFVNNDPNDHPLTGNYLGIMYKGGVIVPMLIAVNFIAIIFTIERFITMSKIKGKGKIDDFVVKIKGLLSSGKIDEAIDACDKQQGSLANVVRAGLNKYNLVKDDAAFSKDKKIELVKTELEEAISLEGPMMSKNLVVISTIASISTLVGLIGTVTGMIKAFAALSHGAPDTAALANGISEALVNTVLGIMGSCIAIIFYSLFTTKVDQLTHAMDEASFTIVNDFSKSVN